MKSLNTLLLILLLGFSNVHAQGSLELKIKGVKDLGLESCNSVEIKYSVINTGENIFQIKIPDHLNYPDELIRLFDQAQLKKMNQENFFSFYIVDEANQIIYEKDWTDLDKLIYKGEGLYKKMRAKDEAESLKLAKKSKKVKYVNSPIKAGKSYDSSFFVYLGDLDIQTNTNYSLYIVYNSLYAEGDLNKSFMISEPFKLVFY